MSDAVAVSVAKAVTSHLTAISTIFAPTVLIERSYADWDMGLDDSLGTATVKIDIVLVTTEQTTELVTRGRGPAMPDSRGCDVRYTVPIDIAIRHKFTDSEQDSDGRITVSKIDDLMYLVQQVHEAFTLKRLVEPLGSLWDSTRITAAPVLKHLRELRQFTGIIRLVFVTDKAIT